MKRTVGIVEVSATSNEIAPYTDQTIVTLIIRKREIISGKATTTTNGEIIITDGKIMTISDKIITTNEEIITTIGGTNQKTRSSKSFHVLVINKTSLI